ncbi:MAG: FtsX-like permease family protein [Candidatus Izemoplasmatales bacterium]|nr:FtsX-like permease family protein [Candidatus Izemoplasmatales bacterium]
MFKRAWISVIRNKGRTIILGVLLFVIANLVLSSISIKSATEEAALQARLSLEPEITLTTNRTDLFAYIKEYKDLYGTRPSQDEINEMLVPITSDVAYGIVENSTYVIDFNFTYSSTSMAVDFLPLTSDGILDAENTSKISVTGTYNPLMLDEFSDIGTFELMEGSSSFSGSDSGVIIISYNLASENNLSIGDTIDLETFDANAMTFTIIGLFMSEDAITSGKSVTDNEVFMPLDDALVLKGQDPSTTFTITSAKYYLLDQLDIDAFIAESTEAFEEISSGELVFLDVSYDAITAPLESVGSFSEIILYISVAAAVVILTLLIVNTLKERKYEIGVLLSLGEGKLKIAAQYLVELVLVALLAFTLSMTTSQTVSSELGDMLLQNEITDVTATDTVSEPKGGGSTATTLIATSIDYDTLEMNVSVSIQDFLFTLGIGLGIIILSSAIPSLYITRYQPKKILSSRN